MPSPSLDRDTRPALLSIVGMVRSGSTFVEGRLADLYGGVAVGELVGAWGAFGRGDIVCSCGEAALDCLFWARVRNHYPGLTDPTTITFMTQTNQRLMPLRRWSAWHALLNDKGGRTMTGYRVEARALRAAVGAAAAELGYRLVVDSSKHPVYYALVGLPVDADTFTKAIPLRVVRDPRAVAHSLRTPRFETTRGGTLFAMKGYRTWRALPFWAAMNAASDRAVPESAIRVRYEDLEREPYLLPLARIGLVRGAPNESGPRHQLIANPGSRRGPAEFRRDDRWLESSRARSVLIGAVLWPLMRRYGYRLLPETARVDPGPGRPTGVAPIDNDSHGAASVDRSRRRDA